MSSPSPPPPPPLHDTPAGLPAAGGALTALYPYTGPAHDPQQLIRASLASSCLRGEMSVWQFQGGRGDNDGFDRDDVLSGRVLRRRLHRCRTRLLRAGVFHRVCKEPGLRREEHLRAFLAEDYQDVALAIANGHTAQAEWLMSGHVRAFDDGLLHDLRTNADRCSLVVLARAASQVNWVWGRRRIEDVYLAASDDPEAIRARESGDYDMALAAASCCDAPHALQWVEHFYHKVPQSVRAQPDRRHEEQFLNELVSRPCTVEIAEWAASHALLPAVSMRGSILIAANAGNFSVMRWLIERGWQIEEGSSKFKPSLMEVVKYDNTEVLKRLVTAGLGSITSHTARTAAQAGSIAALEWMSAEYRDVLEEMHLATTVSSGQLEAVKFLVRKCGFPWSVHVAECAGASLHVLEWAHANNLAMPTTVASAVNGHCVQALQFLLRNAPVLQIMNPVTSTSSILSHGLAMIEPLNRHFPGWLARNISLATAASTESLPVVRLVLDALGPGATNAAAQQALRLACRSPCLEIVEFLHAKFPDISLGEDVLTTAAENGNIDVMEWLITHHGLCPTQDTCAVATERCHLGATELCVRLCAAEASSPWPPMRGRGTIFCGYVVMAEFLVRNGLWQPSAEEVELSQEYSWPMYRFLSDA